MMVFSFYITILLWSVGDRSLVRNSMLKKKRFKANTFSTIISSDALNGLIKLSFNKCK